MHVEKKPDVRYIIFISPEPKLHVRLFNHLLSDIYVVCIFVQEFPNSSPRKSQADSIKLCTIKAWYDDGR